MKLFIGTDNSGHNYLIPANKRKDWEQFCELDEDDEASWSVPEWAIRLNTHFSHVEFYIED